jgi:hypothetical protein
MSRQKDYTFGFNSEQLEAFNALLSDDNVFITGRAGTGKSYIIQQYIKYANDNHLNIALCAPTGLAALNICGVTIHRMFNVPIGPIISYPKKVTKKVMDKLKDIDRIVLDEISMCRFDVFNYIGDTIFKVNKLREQEGKAPIKLAVIGDFLQLPPVITNADRNVLMQYYNIGDNGYAFKSEYWSKFNFKTIMLMTIVRQSDLLTCKALSMVRCGMSKALSYFNAKKCNNFIDDAIYICATNKEAETFNQKKFDEIKGDISTYKAIISGTVAESDKATSDELDLKIGTRVVTLTNSLAYSNGEFGYIVNMGTDNVTVLLDSGLKVKVEPYIWEICDYTVKKGKLDKKVIGTFSQLPLKLGYAVTIHKSQGQTYGKANIAPKCWDKGQLYVALSRVKSIDKMHLTYPIQDAYLVTSQEVLDFYTGLVVTKTNQENKEI